MFEPLKGHITHHIDITILPHRRMKKKNSPGLRTCTIQHCGTRAWPLIFCRPKLNPVLGEFRVRLRDLHDRRLWLGRGAWSIGVTLSRRSSLGPRVQLAGSNRTWLRWQDAVHRVPRSRIYKMRVMMGRYKRCRGSRLSTARGGRL